MNISFIGFGNMAKAIARGLSHDKAYQLRAAAPSLPKGTNEAGIRTDSDNLAVIQEADILILAVKPPQMRAVLAAMQTKLPPNCLIISVASGLSLSWLAQFHPQGAIIRAMPNIAAAVGQAATPLVANQHVNAQQKQWAETIFTKIGLITWLEKESDIDIFTALSGSGPAYVFLFLEAMINAAVTLGITKDIAKTFALQTAQGALSLATETKLNLAELRDQVTSPAGTTAAALAVLKQHGFEQLILNAMKAALERAQELGTDPR